MGLRLWLVVAFLLVCGATGGLAQTDRKAPAFSAKERSVVARNEALSIAFTVDPEVVRRILDEMANPTPAPEGKGKGKRRDLLEGEGMPEAPIDLSRNPDIKMYLQRASPEAAYDLFQILKRVGAVSGPKR